MKSKRRLPFLAFLFILSTVNFNRIQGNENIRTIQFLSIFVMGMLAALLIRETITAIKNKQIE